MTATAVLDLADRGELDLGQDVNRYFGALQLAATYPEPVTTLHLLTHTAGLEELYIGSAARTAAEQLALADYLQLNVPRRVMPPGRAVA